MGSDIHYYPYSQAWEFGKKYKSWYSPNLWTLGIWKMSEWREWRFRPIAVRPGASRSQASKVQVNPLFIVFCRQEDNLLPGEYVG